MDSEIATRLLQLLHDAQDGSAEALNQLFAILRPTLRQTASRGLPHVMRGKLDSSDLAQEALAIAFQALPQFHGSTPEELHAWLRGIHKNVLMRMIEHHTREKRNVGRERQIPDEFPLEGRDETASEIAIAEESREAAQRAFALLPAQMQKAITLRMEHLEYSEVAERMGRTEGAVRRLHARALLCWQELLREGKR